MYEEGFLLSKSRILNVLGHVTSRVEDINARVIISIVLSVINLRKPLSESKIKVVALIGLFVIKTEIDGTV